MTILTGTRLRASAFAGLLMAPVVGLHAQEPRRLAQSDSIPLELATALVSSGGLGGEPQILVGSLPGWISNRIDLPTNGRVLGAAFLGSSVVGIVSVSVAPEAVIADFKQGLTKHGWKAPPPPPSYGGGFRPAPMNDATPTRLTLCGDQQMITASATRRRGTNTELVIRVVPAPAQYSQCAPPPMPQGMSRSPMPPTLFNPVGANDARTGNDCSGSTPVWGTNAAALRTAMAPEALMDHYARQLQDSGWLSTSDKVSIVKRVWTRTDSAGTPYQVAITVTTSARDSTCRDLSLQLGSLKKP